MHADFARNFHRNCLLEDCSSSSSRNFAAAAAANTHSLGGSSDFAPAH